MEISYVYVSIRIYFDSISISLIFKKVPLIYSTISINSHT